MFYFFDGSFIVFVLFEYFLSFFRGNGLFVFIFFFSLFLYDEDLRELIFFIFVLYFLKNKILKLFLMRYLYNVQYFYLVFFMIISCIYNFEKYEEIRKIILFEVNDYNKFFKFLCYYFVIVVNILNLQIVVECWFYLFIIEILN